MVMNMSLDKAIEHGKEKRKPYHGSKAFDRTCRNHGGCPACLSNRTHKHKKREPSENWLRAVVEYAKEMDGDSNDTK